MTTEERIRALVTGTMACFSSKQEKQAALQILSIMCDGLPYGEPSIYSRTVNEQLGIYKISIQGNQDAIRRVLEEVYPK